MIYVIIAIVVIILGGLIPMMLITWPIAKREFANMFVRDSKSKWGRENSCPENQEHSVMFNAGLDWGNQYKDCIKEVAVENDGLKLYGEYFDFGGDKCAVILPGRAESLLYCYYFGEPYRKLGMNVLVADPRAHGESEGTESGIGIKETGDVKAWMEYIQKEFGIRKFVIHGVCIGSSTAIFLAARNLPYLEAIVLEGPYANFSNVLKQRTKAVGKPTFPVVQEMTYLFKKAGVDILKEKPSSYIGKINIPTLFLCGKQDYSSLPVLSKKLFAMCSAPKKTIVWFDEGAHSHLRIKNTQSYDEAIIDFMNSLEVTEEKRVNE